MTLTETHSQPFYIAERLKPLFAEYGRLTQVGALRMLHQMGRDEGNGRLNTSGATVKAAFRLLGAAPHRELCCCHGQPMDVWYLPKPEPDTDADGQAMLVTDDERLDDSGSRARARFKENAAFALEGVAAGKVKPFKVGDNLKVIVRREAGLPGANHWPDFYFEPARLSGSRRHRHARGTTYCVALVARAETNARPGRGYTINRARHGFLMAVQLVMDRRVLYLFDDRRAVWADTLREGVNFTVDRKGSTEYMLVDTHRAGDDLSEVQF